ncbi:MAG: hypothetical protein ACLT16_15995 [[Clostridium] innocuum]
MDNEREKEVEDLEQKAKFTIITMECDDDDENGRSKKILDDAAIQLQRLFQEMRDWLREHADSMEVNERMERLKQETQKLRQQQDRLQRFSQREGVQAGSKKAAAAADKLAGYVQEGIQEVRQNEYVRRSVHAVADTVDTIRNDEQVKKGVRKLKKGTLKAAEAAFQGLKRVLDTDEDDSRKG